MSITNKEWVQISAPGYRDHRRGLLIALASPQTDNLEVNWQRIERFRNLAGLDRVGLSIVDLAFLAHGFPLETLIQAGIFRPGKAYRRGFSVDDENVLCVNDEVIIKKAHIHPTDEPEVAQLKFANQLNRQIKNGLLELTAYQNVPGSPRPPYSPRFLTGLLQLYRSTFYLQFILDSQPNSLIRVANH